MKQSGRKQAMTNTFNRLFTEPREYTPHYKVAYYGVVENCQLCGAALDYSFKLMHASDPDFKEEKSLHVGSDCIVNFAETYVPSMVHQILLNVKKAVETSRVGQFRKAHPTIQADMKMVSDKLNSLRHNNGWLFFRLAEIQLFRKNYKNLVRREYLSKPQVENCYALKAKLDEGKIEAILEDYKNRNTESKFAEDPDTKFLTYFDKYKDKVFSRIYDNTPIYSLLEKQLFVDKVKEYKNKQKKATFKKVA